MTKFGVEVSKGFLAKVFLAVIGFLGSIAFARVLGPNVYGAFGILVALVGVLDNPVTGFGRACKKRISEVDSDTSQILGAGLLVSSTVGLVVLLISVVIRDLPYMDINNGSLYLGILFVGVITFKVIEPMVAGIGEFGTSVVLDALRSLFTIPLQLVLVFLGFELGGMVYGLAAASVLTIPFSLKVLGARPAVPTRGTFSDLWRFAKFSIPKGFVGTTYTQLDILLIGAILGSGLAGQYKVAMNLTVPAILISGVLGSGLFVEVSNLRSQGEGITQRVTTNISFASFLAIPLFFGALAMPRSIVVTVYGPEYAEAAVLLVGLALYQIFSTQSMQVSSVLSGVDRPDINLYIMTATVALNIGLGITLAFEMGAIGVVFATIISEIFKYLALVYFSLHHVSYNVIPDPLKYQFIAGGVMFVGVKILHEVHGVGSWIDLLMIVSWGVIVYGGVLVSLSDIFMATYREMVDGVVTLVFSS